MLQSGLVQTAWAERSLVDATNPVLPYEGVMYAVGVMVMHDIVDATNPVVYLLGYPVSCSSCCWGTQCSALHMAYQEAYVYASYACTPPMCALWAVMFCSSYALPCFMNDSKIPAERIRAARVMIHMSVMHVCPMGRSGGFELPRSPHTHWPLGCHDSPMLIGLWAATIPSC